MTFALPYAFSLSSYAVRYVMKRKLKHWLSIKVSKQVVKANTIDISVKTVSRFLYNKILLIFSVANDFFVVFLSFNGLKLT